MNEALKRGVEAYWAGQMQEADKFYTAILKAQPKHPDANHNMGILAVSVGRLEQALPFFKTAIEVNASIEQYWISYINTLINLNQIHEAKHALNQAEVHSFKGDAFRQFEKRINLKQVGGAILPSQDPPEHLVQPVIELIKKGELQQTLVNVQQLLETFPNSVILYNLQGVGHAGLGSLDSALDSYRQAINIKPDFAEAYNNVGNVLKKQGDLNGAINNYRQAINIKPNYAEAYSNLGESLKSKDDLLGAIKSFKQALKIKPDYHEAHNNFGTALAVIGDLDGALGCYKRALKVKPDFAEAHGNLGIALNAKGDLNGAIKSYRQAIKINPDYADAYSNMGNVFFELANLNGANESFKKALEIQPNHPEALLQQLYLYARLCFWTNTEQQYNLISSLDTSRASSPFLMFALDDSPDRHRLHSENHTKNNFKYQALPLNDKPIERPRRIRIGYFSANFYAHPVAHLIVRVLELHNREDFEIYAYSYGLSDTDTMRTRLTSAVDSFIDVRSQADIDVAKLAREDNLDIAIDLTGYTQHSRTGIFAYRAAPIQISYLGFPGTIGADFMDYIIVDRVLVPDNYRQHYNEKVIRLPNVYMATDNTREISDAVISRSEMGLPDDGFVFCAFNNSYKITPREFDIWMRLLLQVDGSVLWLRSFDKQIKGNLCREARDRGVDSSRLIFAEQIFSTSQHLARHRLADLFLDTFNFNAHSTATDALWAGLPIVTKLGKGFAARVTASLLTSLAMPELITSTEKAYEALALDLATNPNRLREIKRTLSENLLTTPLFDSEQFTKHLESGYLKAYERYFNGQDPTDIQVPNLCDG